MAIEKYTPGATAGWVACMLNSGTSVLNSMTNNSSVLDGADVAQLTNQDVFADFSVSLASVVAAAPAQLNIFQYILNADGTTYGDGQLTTSFAAKTPAPQLYVGSIIFPVGTGVLVGTLLRIPLPEGNFRWAVQSQAGVTLGSSLNTASYRTFNRVVA
jgi:hypothetical protein